MFEHGLVRPEQECLVGGISALISHLEQPFDRRKDVLDFCIYFRTAWLRGLENGLIFDWDLLRNSSHVRFLGAMPVNFEGVEGP